MISIGTVSTMHRAGGHDGSSASQIDEVCSFGGFVLPRASRAQIVDSQVMIITSNQKQQRKKAKEKKMLLVVYFMTALSQNNLRLARQTFTEFILMMRPKSQSLFAGLFGCIVCIVRRPPHTPPRCNRPASRTMISHTIVATTTPLKRSKTTAKMHH